MQHLKNFTLAIFLFILSFNYSSAQDTSSLEPMIHLELGLHGLGVGYALPISPNISLDFSAAFGGGLTVSEDGTTVFGYAPGPSLQINGGARWFYNRQRRFEKGKNMANNAGNYIGFKTKYGTRNLIDYINSDNLIIDVQQAIHETMVTEVHWGLQRNLGRKFFLNAHVGIGYIYDLSSRNSIFGPTGGLKVGFRLL